MAVRRVHFRGTGGSLFLRWLGYSLLSAITFGLATPWLVVAYLRWMAENTEIEGFGGVRFEGTGGGLIVRWLGYWLLLLITFGLAFPWVAVSMIRWTIENLRIDGVNQIQFKGSGGGFFIQWLGYVVLATITFGLATPWLLVAFIRWMTDNSELTGVQQLRFNGTGGNFLIIWLGYTILAVITLGLATPWLVAGIYRWVFGNMELHALS